MELTDLLSMVYFLGGILALILMVAFMFEEAKKINFISALILFFLGWWSFSYYFWLKIGDYVHADYRVGIFNLGFILIPVTYYFWISVFLKKSRRALILLGYLSSGAFATFYIYSLYNNLDVFKLFSPNGLIFLFYFIFIYIGFYVLGVVDLINAIIKSRDKSLKLVNRNILLISVLVIILSILNLPAFYGMKYLFYSGAAAIFLMEFLLAYVALQGKLMNIKAFFAQFLISLILSVNIMEIFFSETIVEATYRFVMLIFLLLLSNLLIRNYRQDIFQKEELLKMGKKLENSNKKLKDLDDAKNEFISIAAHQLRTPPTVIKGYLALAKEDPNNNLDLETRDSLTRAFASNERLIELVEDILNISRIESGKMQYDFQSDQSCEEIIKDLRNNFEVRAKDKGLKLKVEVSKEKLPKITMDSNKIREVISNLIDNSIKYTTEGSITLRLFKTDQNMIRIEVSDTGMGISKNEIGSLFKKFSRGSNADQLAAGGIGLGIYVGRKIIEAHQGKIWAESAGVEKGSTFIIELPIERASA
ncbi:MAG: HAMP domain-containing sensor histidine kinase [Candidatus Moranbacteria bacterium]|jgi:signal transduction histidine kinase|nr:HAMP domain-containing sensor histidine kinase [Candidatus Moranbacteria bacterium]